MNFRSRCQPRTGCYALLIAILCCGPAVAEACTVNVDVPASNVLHNAGTPELVSSPVLNAAPQQVITSFDGAVSPQSGGASASSKPHYFSKPTPLIEAIVEGDAAAVHKLLESNPFGGNRYVGCAAANQAIGEGNFEVFKDLVDHGAEFLSTDGGTCQGDRLSLAAGSVLFGDQHGRRNGGYGTAKIVHFLLEAGADTERSSPYTPLHQFLRVPPFPAQAEIAADFLAHGAHDKDPAYGSALAAAASRYDVDSVRAMLRYPRAVHSSLTEAYLAAIYGMDGYSLYPDPEARHAHQAGAVGALLDAGADVNARQKGYSDETPIVHALDVRSLLDKNLDVADVLLTHGADIRVHGRYGITPLMLAVQDAKRLELMLSHGADVNAQDDDGVTALDRALANSADSSARLAAVAVLLKHGANPNLEDKWHARALNLVLAADHGIIDLLVAHDAVPSTNNSREDVYEFARQQKWVFGPLVWALLQKKPYVAEALIRRDRHIDSDDCGIAYYAAETGETKLLRQAIDRGAKLDVRREGTWYTPLLAAASNGHVETVAVLLNMREVDIDETVYPPLRLRAEEIIRGKIMTSIQMGGPIVRGQTALMLSAENGYVDTVKLLLAHGARRNITDSVGGTALDYAKNAAISNLLKPR